MEFYDEFLEENEEYIKLVKDYANNDKEHGWLKVVHEGKVYNFPKRALIWYVFGKMHAVRDLLPEYKAFTYSGFKMQMDNPYHTDMMLGAGLTDSYHDCIYEARRLIEKEYEKIFSFDFTVLADGRKDKDPYFSFTVYEHTPMRDGTTWSSMNIHCQDKNDDKYEKKAIVIPNAGIEYDLAAVNADIIVCEQGGPMAHLALVSREKGKILIRVDNAIERFPTFSKLWLNLNKLTLSPR